MLSGKSQQKSHEQRIKERPLNRASAMSTWRRTTHGIRTILLVREGNKGKKNLNIIRPGLEIIL